MVIGEFDFEEEKKREKRSDIPRECPYCGSTDIRFHPCLGEGYHKGGWVCFDCNKVIKEGSVPDEPFEEGLPDE